jgi:hypothetical protein
MAPFDILLISIHLAATAAMVGLIWFVQIVHYPLFAGVGSDRFEEYEAAHRRQTSFVVGPLMAIEGLAAVVLAVWPPAGLGWLLPLAGLALLGVIHASTLLLQVPQHASLLEGYDHRRVQRLVRTNWVRTTGWSLRAVLAIAMVVAVSS